MAPWAGQRSKLDGAAPRQSWPRAILDIVPEGYIEG